MTTHLITGAARGVGEAQARQVAAEGVVLALADRGPDDELERVAELCRASGAAVITENLDVCDELAITRFVGAAASRDGRLDFVIANAGIVHSARETRFQRRPLGS